MQNLWSVDDNINIVTWTAVLNNLLSNKDRLLQWVLKTIAAGADNEVLVPERIASLNIANPNCIEKLTDNISGRYRSCGEVDVLSFYQFNHRGSNENVIGTKVAVATKNGDVKEFLASRVLDLPTSLWHNSLLKPDISDNCGFFFLEVSGGKIISRHTKDSICEISFELYTNIWLPWIIRHDLQGEDIWYDNLALASIHTPRLSKFISTVRAETLALGGEWEWESLAYREACRADGIDLSWRP